jgi:hypothetical protein
VAMHLDENPCSAGGLIATVTPRGPPSTSWR